MRGIVLAILLLMAPAAWAELVLQDLKVLRPGASLTVKVSVSNPGSEVEKGANLKLGLFIRPDEKSPWEPFKVWTNFGDLKPGQKACRTFQVSGGDERLRRLSMQPNCQIKARLQAGERVAELVRTQHASR